MHRTRQISAIVISALAASLSSAAYAAQREAVRSATSATEAAQPAAPLRSPFINLRLNPDLGDGLPQVRATLEAISFARIAEPADYELTTKPDFPQTLIAIDAQQPSEDWANDFSVDPARPGPRRVELGNLVLADFSARLRTLVDRRHRANRLIVLASTARPADAESCVAAYSGGPAPANCHRGRIRPGAAGQPSPDELDGETIFTANLRNPSARPFYVALLIVDPWSGIVRVPLEGLPDGAPLAPRATAKGDPLKMFGSASGKYVLLTVTSDRPIDTSSIEQVPTDDDAWDDCLESPAGCVRPEISIPADWSISFAEFHYDAGILLAMGGGMAVLEGMAPWMAEIYSTVPYTRAEIAADALKPPDQREYLAERRSAERNHRCGGTLIAPNLVVTAAHCVAMGKFAGDGMKQVMKDRRVRVGTKWLGRGGTTLAITAVAVPANYSPERQDHDIALLMVKPDRDSKSFEEAVIRLGEQPLAAGTGLTAFGWGYTGTVAPGANPLFDIAAELQRNPDQLQVGQFKVLEWGACRRRMRQRLGTGMVCLVAPGAETGAIPEKNVFSCRGDSGGPLVRTKGPIEELVGVTSWSLGCGYKNIPSVYTDVTKYRRWIKAATQLLKPETALRIDERAAPRR